jgi:hypothetical protein
MLEIENLEKSSESSSDNEDILRIDEGDLSYDKFFSDFMTTNRPVIVKNVKIKTEISEEWFVDGKLNLERIQVPADHEVPIANCSKQYFDSHEKSTMKFAEFVQYWSERVDGSDLLYLKDFHLKQEIPELDFYRVPSYFASDWLNEFLIDKGRDDYRFIYIGPKDSW